MLLAGNVITDAAHTWNDLVTHYNSQERRENRRGRGGQFAGRGPGGRFGCRNRETRALQQDPGCAARPGCQTRNGQAHMLDEGAGQGAGNEDMDQGRRDDNRQEQGNECEEMCYGEEHKGEACDDVCEPFDEHGACGQQLLRFAPQFLDTASCLLGAERV